MDFFSLSQQIIIMTPPILLAITFHEFSHGWVADRLGDPTARMAGRLTMNPVKHLDLMGTLAFVLTRMIGWAKPVPVNHRYFKNPRHDMMLVALAGPGANFLLAIASTLLLRLLGNLMAPGELGMRIILPLALMAQVSVSINVALAVFNLIPLPPLDGGRIVSGLLPLRQAMSYNRIEPYGFLILLLLVISGALDVFFFPLIRWLIGFFVGA